MLWWPYQSPGRSFRKMTKAHTKTKTRGLLMSILLNKSSKCCPDPEQPEFCAFRLGGAPHKVTLLRRQANSYKTPANVIIIIIIIYSFIVRLFQIIVHRRKCIKQTIVCKSKLKYMQYIRLKMYIK